MTDVYRMQSERNVLPVVDVGPGSTAVTGRTSGILAAPIAAALVPALPTATARAAIPVAAGAAAPTIATAGTAAPVTSGLIVAATQKLHGIGAHIQRCARLTILAHKGV